MSGGTSDQLGGRGGCGRCQAGPSLSLGGLLNGSGSGLEMLVPNLPHSPLQILRLHTSCAMDNVADQPLGQLAAAAHQASSSLHDIVSSVARPRPPVSDLLLQLEALTDSLHQLCQQTRGSLAAGLSALRVPLSGCEGACNAIEEQARQQPALLDATEGAANSWTKFKCFDCTTDDLIRLLAAYTATFEIAIADATLYGPLPLLRTED